MHFAENNQSFQPQSSTFSHFCTGRTTFWRFSAKSTSLYKTAILFSPRSARLVTLAQSTPLFDGFQQSARFCTKERFPPLKSTFCHFRTGGTTFYRFSAKCRGLSNTAIQPEVNRFCYFPTRRTTLFLQIRVFSS